MNHAENVKRNCAAWAKMSKAEMNNWITGINDNEARMIRKAMLWVLGVDSRRELVDKEKSDENLYNNLLAAGIEQQ